MRNGTDDSTIHLPPRPADGHKGTFGTVCVIGGQCADGRVMIGGPALAARAALRTGCGLVSLAMPAPILAHGLTIAPEATGIALPVDATNHPKPAETAHALDTCAASADVIAIGPGFGDHQPQQQIVIRLIAQDATPLVIDADALNALAHIRDFKGDFRAQAVLTPHPGEFARLARSLGMDDDTPQEDHARATAAAQLAQRLGCIVVLKGHRTVITDGHAMHINTTGSAALATAGTGDVLTGVIASLIAQYFKPHLGIGSKQISPQQQGGMSLLECARAAVHIHGYAADLWTAQHHDAGMLSSDLLTTIPQARAACS